MRRTRIWLLVSGLGFCLSCAFEGGSSKTKASRLPQVQHIRGWLDLASATQLIPVLDKMVGPHLKDTFPLPSPFANGRVQGAPQRIDGISVRDTWIQRLFDAEGKVLYVAGRFLNSAPREMGLRSLLPTRDQKLSRALAQIPPELGWRETLDFELQLEIGPTQKLIPVWALTFVDRSDAAAWELLLDEDGERRDLQPLHTGFSPSSALIYPRGPKVSGLTTVNLGGVLRPGTLEDPDRLRVLSYLQPQAESDAERKFNFPEKDHRFSQVQVYYFADQALRWMQDKHALSLREPLEIKTHVPGPNGGKSNIARYFFHKIRLGEGDGESYRRLMLDPSVVIHECMHAFVEEIAHLPVEGEGGALNEAYADFLTASLLNNPRMGEVSYLKGEYRRSLENSHSAFSALTQPKYIASELIAGTLWDLRARMETDRAEQLAVRSLAFLGQSGDFLAFVESLEFASKNFLTSSEHDLLREILDRRSWNEWYAVHKK